MLDHLSVDNCFALLFTVRTGSHLCKSALLSHPHVQRFLVENDTNASVLHGHEMITPQPYMTGVKLASAFLYEKARIHEVKCPKISTYRHNKVSQLISFYLAKRENRWQDWAYKDEKIHIPMDEATYWINSWIAAEEAIRNTFNEDECLWVEYGDLVSGKAYEEIQRYLGLPVMELKPTHKKQAQKPNIDYLENLDEFLNSELAGWI